MTVTIEEAQARLPELIEKAAAGEEIVITHGDRPVVELVAPSEERPRRGFGCAKGMITFVADDFDAPLEDFKDYME
jgi:prevent-host-death family protein